MKTLLDNKLSYNLNLFFINYLLVVVSNFDFLHHHIAHKSPIVFLVSFGIIGVILTLTVTRLKIYIPIKILLINLLSAIFAFLFVIVVLYPMPCRGIGCINGFGDLVISFGAMVVYLFFSLKLYVAFAIIGTIYIAIIAKKHIAEKAKGEING